ncbi:hypothetical protein L1987_71289 [Smallanthus sonchifolius]|uniref:Uncharacterized protein n=1 Tax=Smallanthus sonchifolius TaxID=185202 RepID=A0ACB9AR70_9ASTR|nr:hypothetical protein L1987_71289 [Smallanthus sonchifolius]
MNLRIRSGGHDFEGLSYVSNITFVLLDMSNLRSINVNIEEETATVHVGATIGELYYKIWEKSKIHAFPTGVCPTVGVGGHISGGGYGVLMRKYGLTVDNVIDATIVDVNGDSERLVSVMNSGFPELGIQKLDCKEMSWIESELFWSSNVNNPVEILLERSFSPKFSKRISDYLQTPIPRDGIESLWQKMLEVRVVELVFNPNGGRMSEIGDYETPFRIEQEIFSKTSIVLTGTKKGWKQQLIM